MDQETQGMAIYFLNVNSLLILLDAYTQLSSPPPSPHLQDYFSTSTGSFKDDFVITLVLHIHRLDLERED